MLDLMVINNNIQRSLAYCKRYGFKKTIKKALAKAIQENRDTGSTVPAHNFYMPQIVPLTPCHTDFSEKRLNIILPSIQSQHVYGGISTALAFFERMSQQFSCCRIIITDAPTINYDSKRFEEYDINPHNPELSRKSVIPMHDRYGKSLAVGAWDIFIASAWWTAYLLQDILSWQQEVYNLEKVQFFYLIQDFEPGFYAWSSAYALADSTYYSEFNTIAIFNTKLLRDYFDRQGYNFEHSMHFEPSMNEKLLQSAIQSLEVKRKGPLQIVIYGRPSTDRNCFELLIHSLSIWRKTYPSSEHWRIISAGEAHADIDLGGGCIIQSSGKLSLEGYADLLTQSSIGLSLMLSPHPSYPPLEMAAYGLEVITNSFGPKDLSSIASNITSVKVMTPVNIAHALRDACNRVEMRNGLPAKTDISFNGHDPFTNIMEQCKPYCN
jgi:hypothetical protein